MSVKRTRVFFSGIVQGVGFRWTTRNIASNYNIAGYVRNLADGRVEALAEGEEDQVELFLKDLQAKMDRYIKGVEFDEEMPAGTESGFEIRF